MKTFTKGEKCPYDFSKQVVVGSMCCWQCPNRADEIGDKVLCELEDVLAEERKKKEIINAAVEWLDNVLYEGHINSGMNKKRLLDAFRADMEEEWKK